MLRDFVADLRYALRALRKAPGFATIAILTLTLGLGATIALFSVVKGVLLTPLPFQQPDQLVLIGHQYTGQVQLHTGVSAAGFRYYQKEARAFAGMAAVSGWDANFTTGDEPVRLRGQAVAEDYFSTLRAPMVLGRGFTRAETEPGADHEVVVSTSLWRRRLGGDPAIVGKTLVLNGEGYQVVGVAGQGVEFGAEPTEIWKPITFTPDQLQCWGCEFMGLVARLAPGTSLEAAQADLDRVAREVRQLSGSFRDEQWGLWVNRLSDELYGSARTPLLVLLGAVGFVFLIACANVANLLLARATTRAREVAIRTSMGASRGRLTRQLLTESLVLAVSGGVGGLLVAWGAIRLLVTHGPASVPRLELVQIDGTVVAFGALLALGTPLLFGLGPAWSAARANLHGLMKDAGRATGGGLGRFGVRAALVVSQVALSLVLLIGAALMVRSLRRWLAVDPGFDGQHVLTFRLQLPEASYPTGPKQVAFYSEFERSLAALPGAEAVGGSVAMPRTGADWTRSFRVEGFDPGPTGASPWGDFRIVTPGYFRALGIRLVKGRGFENGDDAEARRVAVVDDVMAERYWPGQDPIGKRIGLGGDDRVSWYDVVGVARHVIQNTPRDDRRTQFYVALAQMPGSRLTFAVKAKGEVQGLEASVRAALRRLDPAQPIFAVKPMSALMADSASQPRFLMAMLVLFACVAGTLAAIGIYGVMTFAVSQETREIGIRLALGAGAGRVRGLVLRRGLALAGTGVVFGVVASLATGRLLASQLFQVSPSDPVTLAGVALGLVTVAAGACWVPARRATTVDPLTALKAD